MCFITSYNAQDSDANRLLPLFNRTTYQTNQEQYNVCYSQPLLMFCEKRRHFNTKIYLKKRHLFCTCKANP